MAPGRIPAKKPKRRTESVVTRPAAHSTLTPTPGWIMGDNMANQRGRGGPRRGFVGGARGVVAEDSSPD